MTETLFYLCELILFICPTKNFIFHFFCPKYCLLLKKNPYRYTNCKTFANFCVSLSRNTWEKGWGNVLFFVTYPLLELVVDLLLPGLSVRQLLLHHLGRLGPFLGRFLDYQISPGKKNPGFPTNFKEKFSLSTFFLIFLSPHLLGNCCWTSAAKNSHNIYAFKPFFSNLNLSE